MSGSIDWLCWQAGVVAPSVNVTVPVEECRRLLSSVTTAVTVTVWPKTEGSDGRLLMVVVVALWTNCGLEESSPLLAA